MTAIDVRPEMSVPLPAPLPRRRKSAADRREAIAGWLFISPAMVGLVVFMMIPIVLVFYVSFTNWDGLSNPLSGDAQWVGLNNYRQLLTQDGLIRRTFAVALSNNFWFVLIVVPVQTALALWLAVLVNNKYLKGKSFFRTAFYFPSITSSVAITMLFLFLFQGSGAVNGLLKTIGVTGPNWLSDSRGLFHVGLNAMGVKEPHWAEHKFMSQSIWDWVSGPSITMLVIVTLVIWTTAGTFMLMFLAALQNISDEVDEASEIDGANSWQRFRYVTLPMLRPTVLLVTTLGVISTWQVFDQIYLVGPHNPAVSTPAFMSFDQSFQNNHFGVGSAIAFLLFALIMVLSTLQRRLVKEELD